ncbi:hypothetical protein [Calothrix sp. UHCC 0171]|uniref:hypothetical protein n=1 Tax=Calothrix sp. UHCC 0171 TaxID=3110245 RepID=UPI002B2182F9|nr:hypothetical protein [Calothrix sp. UHCC 0171]MEA5571357.1 hypothetical protein [Calothrix sp. UHCC 0171]
MRKIIPLDSFTILTPDTADVVQQNLKQCLFYRGSISEQGFKITRNLYHSVFTLIKGRLEVQSHQTVVHIQISLHPFLIAPLGLFFLFWYGIAVPGMFASAKYIYATSPRVSIPADGNVAQSAIAAISSAPKGTMPTHLAAIYLGLPIVMLVIFVVFFWADAKQIRRELTQIIRGKI